MAGHSKWAQIKRKKAVADAQKGRVFGKMARAIAVAARGNPDPTTNLRLRGELDRARAANMPSDSIERALQRVTDKAAAALIELQLEFIGPQGVGILAQTVTDNSNRTINELRQLAAANGARMADQGSVAWMFTRSVTPDGISYEPNFPASLSDEGQSRLEVFLEALDAHDDVQDIFTTAQ